MHSGLVVEHELSKVIQEGSNGLIPNDMILSQKSDNHDEKYQDDKLLKERNEPAMNRIPDDIDVDSEILRLRDKRDSGVKFSKEERNELDRLRRVKTSRDYRAKKR